ncbi:XRE family transcriptional regulator, partial [Klebsiella pneumoniae]|nr:XRE family transcriptional regulator [Klebsiella pneumoniae]
GVCNWLLAGEGMRLDGVEKHAYRNRGSQAAHFHSLINYKKEKTAIEPAARQDD